LDNLTDHSAWLILGCVWLVTLFLYILMQCVSPLLPILLIDFELTHSMGGFLYSLPILMIALFSYPLGILSDRMGTKIAVGGGATVATLFSLGRPLSTDFQILLFFTAMFGLGFAMCFPNLPKIVKENFPQHLSGTVTGVYTTAIPLGSGIGIALTKPLLTATGSWQEVMTIWSFMAIPIAIFWWIVVLISKKQSGRFEFRILPKGPVRQRPLNGTPNHLYPSRLIGSILIAGMLLSLLNLIFYSTIGWLPTCLIERGWDPALAATATSIISFTEIPAVLLVPVLSDRTGRKKLIIILSFSLISICSVAVALGSFMSWFVTPILGITFGGIFALLLSLPVELVKREKVGGVAGAIISIGYVGALMGPLITGYLRDFTGSFTVGFMVMAFGGLVAVGLSCALPEGRSSSLDDRDPKLRRSE
jgi:cyanate permease